MPNKRVWCSFVVAMGLFVTAEYRPTEGANRYWNRSRPQFVIPGARSLHPPVTTHRTEGQAGGFVQPPFQGGSDFYCNGYPTRAYKGLITKLP